jgi:predicted DNA binding protein
MPTLVSGLVPADEFVLGRSLAARPELQFELEHVVTSGTGASMPLLWVRGRPVDADGVTLESDPTVDDATLLRDGGDERLYRVEWTSDVGLVVRMLTQSDATILDAVGHEDCWRLRMLYPRRSIFSTTHGFCEDHGLAFDVESIRELDDESTGWHGLTTEQREVLSTAASMGYFEVPRSVTLQEIAEEFDVSHQAVSERLRRATNTLVEDALTVAPPTRVS